MRPSDLYAVRDEITAWCFDRAIYLFGSNFEAALANAENGAKSPMQARSRRAQVFAKWLGVEMKFRDPGKKAAVAPEVIESDVVAGPVSL